MQSARVSMRRFRQTNLDDGVIWNRGCSRWRERRELPQLLRRERDDFHILSEQHHGVDWNGNRSAAETEETAEVDHHHDAAAPVADQFPDVSEHVLAFHGAQN